MSKPELGGLEAALNKMREDELKKNPQSLEDKTLAVEATKDIETALVALRTFLRSQDTLIYMIDTLRALIPANQKEEEVFDKSNLIAEFITGDPYGFQDDTMLGVGPAGIALVALNDFLNSDRFTQTDPKTIPVFAKMEKPYTPPSTMKTPVSIGESNFIVQLENEFFVTDNESGKKFVISYAPKQQNVQIRITAGGEDQVAMLTLAMEMKKLIITNRHIKGKIIEISEGNIFDVKELEEQPFPILDKVLHDDLIKNVVNIFKKKDEFLKYGLPAKRSVILEGGPGKGKTMIERWLAAQLMGEVTTIWVTSKSVKRSSDVAYIFEIARKMSPSLIVMEDLDLISGTRQMSHGGDNVLGEMLNQMDGLTQDSSIVMIGSTNKVANLDEALADRPGRFDRIFKVGKPDGEVAAKIARNYLLKRGVLEQSVDDLNLESFFSEGDLSGAQVVEVCKGAIFEAIHRASEVTEVHLNNSRKGLLNQRQLLSK